MEEVAPARGLSEEAMLAGLRDLRLPVTGGAELAADLCAAFALGLLAALALGLLLRAVTRRAPRRAETGIEADLARLAALPDEARRLALLHLLRGRAPERVRTLGPALYRPGGLPEAAWLEAELRRP
ncbi:hypothetical protein [Roseivivax sp. CAU 1761]